MVANESKTKDTRKHYGTVQDAVELLNVSERTVRRMIKAGRLHTIRDATNHLWIDLDDIEKEQAARPRSASPLRHQVQLLLAQVEELKAHQGPQERRMLDIECQVEALQQRVEACEQLLFRGLQTVSKREVEGETDETPGAQISRLLSRLRRSGVQRPSPLDKRGLPPGTLRLVRFAQLHQVKIEDIKHLFWAGKIELAVYHREAQRNKQEWWITPEQHEQLTAYWQQHAIPYVTCPQCAHEDHLEAQAG